MIFCFSVYILILDPWIGGIVIFPFSRTFSVFTGAGRRFHLWCFLILWPLVHLASRLILSWFYAIILFASLLSCGTCVCLNVGLDSFIRFLIVRIGLLITTFVVLSFFSLFFVFFLSGTFLFSQLVDGRLGCCHNLVLFCVYYEGSFQSSI